MGIKQVIVIRNDINIGKGKACAQVAHASLEAYKKALKKNERIVREWELTGSKKVVLKAELSTILEKMRKAEELGLTTALIRDAGLTQLPSGTITALAIGPDEEAKIDMICKELKLY